MESKLAEAIDVIFDELKLPREGHELSERGFGGGIDSDIAERYGRLVAVVLASYGNRDMAYRAIDRAFEINADEQNATLLDSTVDTIFPTKIANKLAGHSLWTIRDVCELSVIELLQLEGILFRTAQKIQKILEKHGFELKQ